MQFIIYTLWSYNYNLPSTTTRPPVRINLFPRPTALGVDLHPSIFPSDQCSGLFAVVVIIVAIEGEYPAKNGTSVFYIIVVVLWQTEIVRYNTSLKWSRSIWDDDVVAH